MRILVDKDIKYFKEIVSRLSCFKNIEFFYENQKFINNKNLHSFDGVFIRSLTKVDSKLISNTKLKLIGSATSGIDHINKKILNKKRIELIDGRGGNANSVVHYVMSAIAFLNKVDMFDINKHSIGIMGYGNIGKQLKKTLDYFNINHFVYDPFLNFNFLSDIDSIKKCNLISLHVPLAETGDYPTLNLIERDFIKTMKAEILINTSRGDVVSEDEIFKKKKLIYVSDVWKNEPIPNPTAIKKSFIATPHIAGHSIDGKFDTTKKLLINFLKYLNISKEEIHIANFSKKTKAKKNIRLIDYLIEYDIFSESEAFKSKIQNNKKINEKHFKNSRKNHLSRNDIVI